MMMHAVVYGSNHYNFLVYQFPFWRFLDITFFWYDVTWKDRYEYFNLCI
jgi:hypothetical protein